MLPVPVPCFYLYGSSCTTGTRRSPEAKMIGMSSSMLACGLNFLCLHLWFCRLCGSCSQILFLWAILHVWVPCRLWSLSVVTPLLPPPWRKEQVALLPMLTTGSSWSCSILAHGHYHQLPGAWCGQGSPMYTYFLKECRTMPETVWNKVTFAPFGEYLPIHKDAEHAHELLLAAGRERDGERELERGRES